MKNLTPSRESKMTNAIAQKQPNITLVFDNVKDPHNIFAAMRTADAVGLVEVYSINTLDNLFVKKPKSYLGANSSSSAKKWVTLHEYTDYESCFKAVKAKYDKVYATHLNESSVGMYQMDLTQSIALVFGNERFGVSDEVLPYCDGNFSIPQVGMIESLNISVACAVTLYEAYRQRTVANMYAESSPMTGEMRSEMFEKWREM
jgi:tRNA (guanosine-2'-O-)-methyltransferase